ncbi:MAG: cytochrome c [Proteobacteria bacterium]|nr:cytochrome c [Pseudomonadota bacterium]
MKSLCLLMCFSLAMQASAQSTAEPTPARQHELIRLVRQDCGSCHGMTLKGGLGLPLLPDSLRDKPASSLAATVVHGRPGTAMPPWKTILAEGEAEWIVSRLLTGFPKE